MRTVRDALTRQVTLVVSPGKHRALTGKEVEMRIPCREKTGRSKEGRLKFPTSSFFSYCEVFSVFELPWDFLRARGRFWL